MLQAVLTRSSCGDVVRVMLVPRVRAAKVGASCIAPTPRALSTMRLVKTPPGQVFTNKCQWKERYQTNNSGHGNRTPVELLTPVVDDPELQGLLRVTGTDMDVSDDDVQGEADSPEAEPEQPRRSTRKRKTIDATGETTVTIMGREIVLRGGTDDAKIYKEIFGKAKVYKKSTYQTTTKRKEMFDFGIEKDEVVLDLGANVGLFALWALQEGASKAICVEGYPEALEQLRVNLAPEIEDGRVIVIDKAVALEGGNTVMMKENGYRTRIVENGGDFEVETVAMQDLLRDYESTFCKMDIEMAELDILMNKELDWMETRRLAFEFSTPHNQRQKQRGKIVQLDQVARVMHTHGFSTVNWQPSRMTDTKGAHIDPVLHCYRNPQTLAVLRELRKNDHTIQGDSRAGPAYDGRDSLELGLASRALTEVPKKDRGIAATKATLENPELTKMLTKYICDIVEDEEFLFSSILITKHSEYGLHTDSKNVGRSVVITLGDHVGGEIWQASAKIDGQELPGGPIFAHNEPHYFDGNIPHCTLPFEGERYSIIAYLTNSADSKKFADADRHVYDQFGFRIPPKGEEAPRPEYEPKRNDARLDKATPEHEEFLKDWKEQTSQGKRSRKRGGKASAGFVGAQS